MTVVAVTGHRNLDDESLVRRQIDGVLAGLEPPLTGVSALAAGADQIFADAILSAGGALEAVVPARDYRDTLDERARAAFDRLLDASTTVTTMDHEHSGRAAYLAAGLEMLERCGLLIAVWDGEVSRGDGGTADMVRRARERGVPVRVVQGTRAG